MRRSATLMVFLIPAAACAAWTVYAGKDVNWDLLNYHYYLPFELLAGRLEQDFFAASAQSYLNPVGYIPFYLMVSWGWHSVLASAALAVTHSLSLALLYFLAYRLFAHLPGRDRVLFSVLATAMGAATGVFWATVGSSFLDPLLVPPMLGGLLLLLAGGEDAFRKAALAGALFGVTAALKYSNAIFAVAALPLALAMPGLSGRSRLRALSAYVAGGAAALAVLAGPWLAMMYHEFANPVFPLLNAWFQSPLAPPINLASERFSPEGWVAALRVPFRMVSLDRTLYSENFAPDIRFAALAAAAAAMPALVAARRAAPARSLRGTDWRLFAFFGTSMALWLGTSANGRYGLVVLLLAGVCLVRSVERLLPAGAARVALVIALAIQVGTSIMASPPRWFIAAPWSKRWLPYDVPERALREPALYLSVEVLPMAVVAPFLHPESSFVNFRGQHSLPSDAPRLAALLARYRGHVRALGRQLELVDGLPRPAVVKVYDDALRQLGFRLDPEDCFTIAWRPENDALSRIANRIAVTLPSSEPLSVVSCGLRAAARDPADIEAELRMSAIFARIERRCPLLRGQTAVTERFGSGWFRHYNGLDARLEAFGGRVVLHRFRSAELIDLGRVSEWQREDAPLPAACGAGA